MFNPTQVVIEAFVHELQAMYARIYGVLEPAHRIIVGLTTIRWQEQEARNEKALTCNAAVLLIVRQSRQSFGHCHRRRCAPSFCCNDGFRCTPRRDPLAASCRWRHDLGMGGTSALGVSAYQWSPHARNTGSVASRKFVTGKIRP